MSTTPAIPETTLAIVLTTDELRAARSNWLTARAAYQHSPTGGNELWLRQAVARLDSLLDACLDLDAQH